MTLRGYQHKEKVGPHIVTEITACAWHCEPCGEVEIPLHVLAGYQRRAAAIALREVKEVDGSLMKYARKALGLTQTELGVAIDCPGETVSRYEADEMPVPTQVRLAVARLLLEVGRAGRFGRKR